MKSIALIIVMLTAETCFVSPIQAQSKFFENEESGWTAAAMYKTVTEYIDSHPSSGFGVVGNWSSPGVFDFGLEVLWRKHTANYYTNATYDRSRPDLTPFISVELMPGSPNAGFDLFLSYTRAGEIRVVVERPYDFDYMSDTTGSSILFVGEFYRKYNWGPSVQAIPLLRAGAQRINSEFRNSEQYSYGHSVDGSYMGPELNLVISHKYFVAASFSMFRKHGWQGVYHIKAGVTLFRK